MVTDLRDCESLPLGLSVTVDEVADQTPIPSNWSIEIPRRLQEYRYMVVTAEGSKAELTIKNPGEGQRTVVTETRGVLLAVVV